MKIFAGLFYAILGMTLGYLHAPNWVFELVFFLYGSLVTVCIFNRTDEEDMD